MEREGKQLEFVVHTDMDKSTGEGKIGVMSDPSSVEARLYPRHSFFPAIGQGFYQTFHLIALSFKGIASLLRV